jgi:hypothetical protein
MTTETTTQKIARLELEKKEAERRAKQAEEESMFIGFALGRGPGTRATRMMLTGELTGAFD